MNIYVEITKFAPKNALVWVSVRKEDGQKAEGHNIK